MALIRDKAERCRFFAFAESLGFPLEMTAEPYKPTRTNPQNNYLFGVAYPPIAEHTGYEVDGENGLHTFMCGTFFGWVDKPCPKTPSNPEGICSVPYRTTTRNEHGKRDVLKKEPFAKFVKHVQKMGAEAGVFVPDPET